MKKYTQTDFDNFEVDECGHKICPAGDYTAIKGFGAQCNFGAQCSFGERCRFKERVKKVHAGTIHEKTYLAACDLAELMLKGGNEL